VPGTGPPRPRLDQHLEAVRPHVGHTCAAAVSRVVHRVVVAARRLEGAKMRIGHGRLGAGLLAERKILEPARLGQAVGSADRKQTLARLCD